MKKRIIVILLTICIMLPSTFFFVACKKKQDPTTAFCQLEQGQTLNVGNVNKYKNSYESREENYYLTYISSYSVSLNRTSSSSHSNSCLFNGYYYYWSYERNTNNVLLGTKTINISNIYSYLLYGQENNNIVVKTKTITETIYHFTTRKVERPCEINYDLRGYFNSIQLLQVEAPEIYSLLAVSETYTYEIDEPVTTYSYSEQKHTDTYFYFT